MSLLNDPRANCEKKKRLPFLQQQCVVYLITILCLRYVGLCAAGIYLRHLAKGTCAPSYPVASSTLIWDLMRLLNTDLVPAVIHTFQPSFVLSTLYSGLLFVSVVWLFFFLNSSAFINSRIHSCYRPLPRPHFSLKAS